MSLPPREKDENSFSTNLKRDFERKIGTNKYEFLCRAPHLWKSNVSLSVSGVKLLSFRLEKFQEILMPQYLKQM